MVFDGKTKWNFLPIDKKFQKETFDCGYPILNDYLKKYARQNHNKGIAKVFVALEASGSLKIDGYYTVNASIIEYESIPESIKRGIPAYPVPAMLIGKLAVDNSVKGQGLGGKLLADALLRAVRAGSIQFWQKHTNARRREIITLTLNTIKYSTNYKYYKISTILIQCLLK